MDSPEQAFASILRQSPTAPFVTYYDGNTGERSELSARSCANWVAKTYYLVRDELGLGVTDTASVNMPAHWITVPILLGTWFAGLTIGVDLPDAAVAFVSPQTVASSNSAADVYAVDPGSAARGFGSTPPPGTQDYLTAVRPQPDAWPGVHATAAADDALLPGLSRRAAMAAADRLPPGTRLLVTRPWAQAADWVPTVLATLAAHGSMVITHAVVDADRIAAQERTTATW